MPHRARVLIPLLIILIGGGWLIYRALAPGTSGPDATAQAAIPVLFAAQFPDADGKVQSLSQWQHRVLVVNFWATWCPPCLEEMPELSALHDKHHERGLTVLGISTDKVDKIQNFAQSTPVNYPLLAADFEGMQLAESLGNRQGVLPYTVVLDKLGNITFVHYGRLDMATLEHALMPLLQPQI